MVDLVSRCFACLNVALNDLTRLKTITGLQRHPSINITRLYTNHSLIPILWHEITNRLRALPVRVPDDGIREVVPNDIEPWLALVENTRSILFQRLVDAIGLAFKPELIAR